MKNIVYILILIALPLLGFGADGASTLVEQGNAKYAKADYKGAVSAYQKVVDEGFQSATVYFNLGNAYYKLGDVPSALLYYEKAHKLAPNDNDINFNIQFANTKTTDKIDEVPQLFLINWWHSIIMALPLGTLSALSALLFLAGFGLLAYYLFAHSVALKKASFYSGPVVLLFGLMTMFIASRQAAYFDEHHEAIIFSPSVTVKSSPNSASKNLFVIHDGTKVGVVEVANGWMKVKLVNGNEGWISSADGKEI